MAWILYKVNNDSWLWAKVIESQVIAWRLWIVTVFILSFLISIVAGTSRKLLIEGYVTIPIMAAKETNALT